MKFKYFVLSLLLAPLVALASPNMQQGIPMQQGMSMQQGKSSQQDPRCKPNENKFIINTFVKGKQEGGQGTEGFSDISGTAYAKQGPDNKPRDTQVFTPHGTTFETEFEGQDPCPKE